MLCRSELPESLPGREQSFHHDCGDAMKYLCLVYLEEAEAARRARQRVCRVR